MHDDTVDSPRTEATTEPADTGAHPQMWAVNLVSDPIHGYIELTKRLTSERADRLGLGPEKAAEGDLLDSAWLQRMRRISQLQSARWVFPTAEHSRFTHSLGVMHEAGCGLATCIRASARRLPPQTGTLAPARGWSLRRCVWPDSCTTWATVRSRTSSTSTCCATFPRRPTLAASTRA